MATATKTTEAPAKKRAPRTPPVTVDFSNITAKPADTPVVQNRGNSLSETPVPQWLRESWAARRDGVGAPVELSPRPEAEVKALKQLMIRAIQGGELYGLAGVGVKFQETKTADGIVLKFQTRTRKARTPKA